MCLFKVQASCLSDCNHLGYMYIAHSVDVLLHGFEQLVNLNQVSTYSKRKSSYKHKSDCFKGYFKGLQGFLYEKILFSVNLKLIFLI